MQNTKSLSLFPVTRSYTAREKVTANNTNAEIKATGRYCGERITFTESFLESDTLAAKGAGNSDIWLDVGTYNGQAWEPQRLHKKRQAINAIHQI
jgi:hypothetical protein